MIAHLFTIQEVRQKGKGLFATQFIPKGTIVAFECVNCQRIPVDELKHYPWENREFILTHGYLAADDILLMPCDEAIYLNHSCNANILDSGAGFDIVVRDIKQAEEATYDYRMITDATTTPIDCHCGEPNCCRILNPRTPVPTDLKQFWNRQVASSVPLIHRVPQPLSVELMKNATVQKYLNRRVNSIRL